MCICRSKMHLPTKSGKNCNCYQRQSSMTAKNDAVFYMVHRSKKLQPKAHTLNNFFGMISGMIYWYDSCPLSAIIPQLYQKWMLLRLCFDKQLQKQHPGNVQFQTPPPLVICPPPGNGQKTMVPEGRQHHRHHRWQITID